MEEMSGILIGFQVYLQGPIQPQTHTVTLIKYHLTVCGSVCKRRNKSTWTHTHSFQSFSHVSVFIYPRNTHTRTQRDREAFFKKKKKLLHTCGHLQVCLFMSLSPYSYSFLQSLDARETCQIRICFPLKSSQLRFTKTSLIKFGPGLVSSIVHQCS